MGEDGSRKLTHEDAQGRVRMVNVGEKEVTRRRAVAEGWIRMQATTLAKIRRNELSKGQVLAAAQIAGITTAKRTSEWIPLCHPLPTDFIDVELTLDEQLPGVSARATVEVTATTGAEMEALVAVSSALLTVYDMCKGVDRGMEIEGIRLLEKRGGRSETWKREDG